MILSFAQYERELAGERVRDKFLASRKRGLWMGGHPPLGYDVADRKLLINAGEAELVKHVFLRFLQVGSATRLAQELNTAGRRTKRGEPFDKGVLYKLLHNRTYIGEVEHKGTAYPGQHEASSTGAPVTGSTRYWRSMRIAAPAGRAPRLRRCSRA
jgi:hypothetical protein